MKTINNKAYEFCKKAADLKTTPKFVRLKMKDFIKICECDNDKYIACDKKIKKLENIKLLIMPKSLKSGKTFYECTTGHQWLFILLFYVLCIKTTLKNASMKLGL